MKNGQERRDDKKGTGDDLGSTGVCVCVGREGGEAGEGGSDERDRIRDEIGTRDARARDRRDEGEWEWGWMVSEGEEEIRGGHEEIRGS